MIGFLGRLLHQNSDVTYFVCGLAYVILGVTVLIKPRQKSSFSLAHIIGLLSGFAIFYGVNEWLKMWAVIKGHGIILEVARATTILVSYILLFEFARRLLFITPRSNYDWRKKTAILFNWWLPLVIELYIITVVIFSFDLWNIPRIWSGYLLGFPGGILISLGFLYYYRDEKYLLEPLKVKKYFIGASISFLALGVLEGLIVPKGNFFPANLVNTESFYAYFKIPVQVFRAICAIVATRSVAGILTIFDLETVNRLEETQIKLSDELEERKKIEVRIEKAYMLNRMILEKAPFGIFLINKSGNIDYVNPSMVNISGDTYEELKGLNVFEHPGYKKIGLEQKVRNVLANGEPFFMGPIEYTAHYSGKTTIRNFSGILLEEGSERKALVFIEDITEQKRAEEALRAKEEEYHTLVDNLNIGVYRNTAGSEGCFLQANPAMVKMFGYDSAEEFMKIKVSELYEDPRDRQKFVEKVKKEGSVKGVELRLKKKSGIPIWASVTAKSQLDENGEIKWLDGAIEDITERKSAEELLRKAYRELKETQQELIQTEKFAALGRFSSGLAHEIKNPLAIVLGGVEFLELKLSGTDEDTLLALDKIKEATLRADSILRKLLEFARPSNLKFEEVTAENLINEALSLFKYRVYLSNIEIKTQFEEGGIVLTLDKNQIQQVIFNILLNSVEGMPRGGEIKISVRKALFTEFTLERLSCIIEITDNGEGIDKKVLPRIFDPFYTTKKDKRGTGLGLYISKMIINNHEGDIIIESEKGKGTTVKVILPIKEREVA